MNAVVNRITVLSRRLATLGKHGEVARTGKTQNIGILDIAGKIEETRPSRSNFWAGEERYGTQAGQRS